MMDEKKSLPDQSRCQTPEMASMPPPSNLLAIDQKKLIAGVRAVLPEELPAQSTRPRGLGSSETWRSKLPTAVGERVFAWIIRFLLATVLTVLLIFLNVVYSIPTPDVSGGQSPLPGWSQLKYFFVFGDSYTQTGFNLTNGSPLPAPGNPLGNPPFPGFTSSSGPNWIDFLTTEFNRSAVLTYNMAFGGATVDADLIDAFEPTVLSIKDQVETLFLPNLANQTFWTSSDSLFFIWDGVNDVGRSYSTGVDLNALYDKVIAEYFVLVNELYDGGARNFMFLDVPPTDRSPGTTVLGPDVEAQEKAALALFNGKLAQGTGQFLQNHTDARAFIFKSSAVFTKLLDDPAPFGIKNTTDFCEDYSAGTTTPTTFIPECGIPVNEYLWLNTLHPTWTVHQEVAKELANFV